MIPIVKIKPEFGANLGCCSSFQECAKRIAKVSADAKLEVDEETYLNQFKPHLMDVVFAWANGATFAQICKMTDVFEGEVEVIVVYCYSHLRQMPRNP